MPEKQKTIDLLLESRGIRLDIYVKDENNTVYNVEMQRGKHRNLPKRLRYYQGNIDLDLISKGEDYKKLSKSYIILYARLTYLELEDTDTPLKPHVLKILV